jgi:UDP:flavonoid glycosyltransferase YjiC (YdhE family)
VDELGFGMRLSTYEHSAGELCEAVDSLLGADDLRARMAPIAERLQRQPGTATAADLIERVAETGELATRD